MFFQGQYIKIKCVVYKIRVSWYIHKTTWLKMTRIIIRWSRLEQNIFGADTPWSNSYASSHGWWGSNQWTDYAELKILLTRLLFLQILANPIKAILRKSRNKYGSVVYKIIHYFRNNKENSSMFQGRGFTQTKSTGHQRL